MKYKQQNQTKKFFEKDAKNWSSKSDFKKNIILNTIQERNLYVIDKIRKFKIKSLIDVGCGSGDLAFEASKILDKSGKTLVNINLVTDDNILQFKLKNSKNLDRKSLNLLKKQQIQATIS